MGSKHVPQRTCVACRRVEAKRDLTRVVRSPDGKIFVDETGKANGRGAYLCRDRACWEKAIGRPRGSSSGSLAYSLKAVLSEEDRSALLDYAQRLPDTVSVDANHKLS